jgi:transposase
MALAIRSDMTAAALRAWARRAASPRASSRAFAIAHAMDGLSRAEAARLAGMERQALRDAVVRYNAEGIAGLFDRPRSRRGKLTEGQQATLRALLLRGPDPERDGISAWTRADIADLIAQRFGHRYHVSSLSKVLRSLGFSRQKARPVHPAADPKARAAWIKKAAARSPARRCRGPSRQADHVVLPG